MSSKNQREPLPNPYEVSASVARTRKIPRFRTATIIGAAVAGALGLAALCLIATVVISPFSYGADFDYPPQAAVPPGATVLATDTASDDDGPLRLSVEVADMNDWSMPQIADFYRATYPESEGWQIEADTDANSICLVRPGPDYIEVLDVWPFNRAMARDRYLASMSRFGGSASQDLCGASGGWIDGDLLRAQSQSKHDDLSSP